MKPRFLLLAATLLCPALLMSEDSVQDKMRPFTRESYWVKQEERPAITRALLVQALEKSRSFYLNNQKDDGSFNYIVNLETGRVNNKKNNPVRQAGALWGLACLNRDRFNEPTRQAVVDGIKFFSQNIQKLPTGRKCVVFPQNDQISTGMVALYCLSLIDYLRGEERHMDAETSQMYRQLLDIHLDYLKSMELPDGSWAKVFNVAGNITEPEGSPYYDGEALLAYCKAARYLGHTELLPRINEALPKLIAKYTVELWSNPSVPDDASKGFYQWCCMSLNEYVMAGWDPHRQLAIDTSLAYSYWLIHHEKVASRTGNTAYAVEGLISSWNIATMTGNRDAQKKLEQVIFDIMGRLMILQLDGPLMSHNPVLSKLVEVKRPKESLVGGITSSLYDTTVRIDTQQHQTHAMLLMLDAFFTEK